MERKALKTISNLLSKTAGLVFFSFLAISLGVVFGLLFEGWVKDQPGTPVGTTNSTIETVDLPVEQIETSPQAEEKISNNTTKSATQSVAEVKYKVRVGPYASRNEALTVSKELEKLGYPVYVGNSEPFAVQVGAFGTQNNAEKLKQELNGIGFKSYIETK
ncbi:MAG TPA: SPOR domain-containing protein [Bacillota bacterium]|nr:SPOR domain-containing protein [Bacillota bacterium]HOL10971.1 SPOR domain-containing protein [Bacillota bacterium]HPO97380.1 SPOR domain-containing protein [Bacillota bacterium]